MALNKEYAGNRKKKKISGEKNMLITESMPFYVTLGPTQHLLVQRH